jgi:hypothetical protein
LKLLLPLSPEKAAERARQAELDTAWVGAEHEAPLA